MKLFCRHSYRPFYNLYGDCIIAFNYKRSVWKCKFCGKYQYRDYLIEEDEMFDTVSFPQSEEERAVDMYKFFLEALIDSSDIPANLKKVAQEEYDRYFGGIE